MAGLSAPAVAQSDDATRLASLEQDTPVRVLYNQDNPSLALWFEAAKKSATKLEQPPVSAEVGTGWTGVSHATTTNDGLQLGSGSFNGQSLIFSCQVPFFEHNGTRYQLLNTQLIAGPTVRLYVDGSRRIESTYLVPVVGGNATIRQIYWLGNRPGDAPGFLKPWISYSGPAGTYNFYFRFDFDVRGAGGDRSQDFRTIAGRNYWAANAAEYSVAGTAPFYDDNLKLRTWDGTTVLNNSIVAFAPFPADASTLYAVNYSAVEVEGPPATLVNGGVIQTVDASVPVGNPTAGSDLVHWYRATRATASGVVGPDLEVGNPHPRQCFVEIDKLASVNFPPSSVAHNGCTPSMENTYAPHITLTVHRDRTDLVNPHPGIDFTNAELHDMMTANWNYRTFQQDAGSWYAWIGIVTTQGGTLGIMFDWDLGGGADPNSVAREGCAVFHDNFLGYTEPTRSKALLRTQTHELGHVFNLEHGDGSSSGSAPWDCTEGFTIMNQTGAISPFPDAIRYFFGPAEATKLNTWHDPYIMPGGVSFTTHPVDR
jgi:hypothetical protein